MHRFQLLVAGVVSRPPADTLAAATDAIAAVFTYTDTASNSSSESCIPIGFEIREIQARVMMEVVVRHEVGTVLSDTTRVQVYSQFNEGV